MNEAFFFGQRGALNPPLFGTCTLPQDSAAPSWGVLICHAFSEERQKTYRSTFLFAQELARAGIPSMRFDYQGTGDSHGSLAEATVDSMVDNGILALSEARARLGVEKIVLLGVRLGAAIAARIAQQAGDIDAIVFWNPVVEGKRYFRDLTRTEAMINLARKKSAAPAEKSDRVEVDAEYLSPELVSQLKQLDLANDTHAASSYLITGRESDKIESRQLEKLAQNLNAAGKDVTRWNGEVREFWSSRSMYDAFYPTATFEKTLAWLGQ